MVAVRHGNGELLRRTIEALSGGVAAGLCGALLDPDVLWQEPGRNRISGDYGGCDEVVNGLFERIRQLSDGTYGIVGWESVTSDADRAVGVYVVEARREGRDLRSRDVCVIEVRAGVIVAGRVYHGDQHAGDRFWS
jgi:ketosteroid isomerase-like protein